MAQKCAETQKSNPETNACLQADKRTVMPTPVRYKEWLTMKYNKTDNNTNNQSKE